MKLLFVFICLSLFLVSESSRVYKVVASKYYSSPIISKSTGSVWDYNYNAAVYNRNGGIGLIVRCQDLKNEAVPFSVGPSYLSISQVEFNSSGFPSATPTKTLAYVPNNTTEKCGTEDPRISYFNGTYYLFFTAYNCTNAMLSSATTTNPADPNSWVRNGYVFPEKRWSKSAASLFATPENGLSQHYLFWGDDSISVATSTDTIHWKDTGNPLIKTRSNFFDSNLVESGPAPIQLASGDFFFIYNSARSGYPSVKPDWQLQYNVGFAILSKTDPTKIVQRSDVPVFSPTYDWEIGNASIYLTPNVVFLEGLVADPHGCPTNVGQLIGEGYARNAECFFGVYGGADSDLGAVRIVVSSNDQVCTSQGKCFVLFYGGTLNWADAERVCAQSYTGGHLASLHSAFDQDILVRFLSMSEVKTNLWLGASRTTPNDPFKWVDGSNVDYSHYLGGGTTAPGQGNCIQACESNTGGCAAGFWRAADCNIQAQFVCEYKQ